MGFPISAAFKAMIILYRRSSMGTSTTIAAIQPGSQRRCYAWPSAWPNDGASVKAKTAPAGFVEVASLESVCPGALVVFFGEVAGAVPGEEGFSDGGCVLLIAWAPGCGWDVHDVSPALLVGDGRHAVDHVAVPPHRVTGLDVGDAAEGLQRQVVPLVGGGEGLADGDTAHVVAGNVGEQWAQQKVGHCAGDGDRMQDTLVVGHVGHGGPA